MLQTQKFQTASQKMKKDQGSWFGAASAGNPATVRRASSAMQLSSRAPSEPRPGSVSPSINFSYPRARMHSPSGSVQSEPAEEHTLVYDPNSRRMVPRQDFFRRSLSVRDGSELKPLKKKKKNVSRSGSHLSKGTIGRTQSRSTDDLLGSGTMDQQATEDELLVGTTTRPALVKKPSIVKEEPEEEDLDEQPPPTQPATKTLPTKSANKRGKKKGESANGKTTPSSKAVVAARPDRVPSESPARSTRFASSTDQLAVRHEPPPRSLSPRKSALKHSSPTRAISPSDDGSEASALALSADDAMARKKSARVSWDDRNTVVVGESVQPQDAEPPLIPSPQVKKSWHGLVGGKQPKKDNKTADKEETMSPRPALPSFGSVREKKAKEPEERPLVRPAERTWSPQPSSTDAGESSDGVSVPDNVTTNTKDDTSEPTSSTAAVAEAADESSSDGGLMDDTSEDESSLGDKDSSADVPTISISQPSPRLPTENDHAEEEEEDANEPGESSTHAPTAQMDDIEELEENDGDQYSDAYEQIAEVEGDGFMSLDAVLESKPESQKKTSVVASVPSDANNEPADAEEAASSEERDDWENAKAYWKSLSLEQRRQLEVEALTEGGDHGDNKRDSAQSQSVEKPTASPKTSERSYQIQPGTSWDADNLNDAASPSKSSKLRKSPRQKDANQQLHQPQLTSVSMRKSMRGTRPTSADGHAQAVNNAVDNTVQMKKSLRQRPATADDQPRPVSYHERSKETVKSHHRNLSDDVASSPTSAGRGYGKNSKPRRRGSDSSESSFTRKGGGSGGAHEFRRSMRGSIREPQSPTQETKDTNRFSLRALSPTGFRRNSVSSLPAAAPGMGPGAGRMRQSLRGESVGATPRKRMSTFGRSPGKGNAGRGGSRFADSSDEEDEGPLQLFRSRFVDSSDEEDEEDLARPASQGRGLAKTLRSKTGRATASAVDLRSSANGFESPAPPIDDEILQSRPLEPPPAIGADGRPSTARRGSFISMLRRKKDPHTKISRDAAARQGPNSGGTESQFQNIESSGLHTRDDSWPLPDASPGDSEAERPFTAAGPVAGLNTKTSKFARRRSASQGMVGLNHTTLDGQHQPPPKKKKFGALRKMLGIHD